MSFLPSQLHHRFRHFTYQCCCITNLNGMTQRVDWGIWLSKKHPNMQRMQGVNVSDRCRHQKGWILGKVQNGLWPPTHFRKIMLQLFYDFMLNEPRLKVQNLQHTFLDWKLLFRKFIRFGDTQRLYPPFFSSDISVMSESNLICVSQLSKKGEKRRKGVKSGPKMPIFGSKWPKMHILDQICNWLRLSAKSLLSKTEKTQISEQTQIIWVR